MRPAAITPGLQVRVVNSYGQCKGKPWTVLSVTGMFVAVYRDGEKRIVSANRIRQVTE